MTRDWRNWVRIEREAVSTCEPERRKNIELKGAFMSNQATISRARKESVTGTTQSRSPQSNTISAAPYQPETAAGECRKKQTINTMDTHWQTGAKNRRENAL